MKKSFLFIFASLTMTSLCFGQLYDHTGSVSTSGLISAYMVDKDTLVQSADDFIIPTGGTWDITSVTTHGFRNNPGANMDSILVEIYSDVSGSPSTVIYSAIHQLPTSIPSPQNDTAITITIPTQTLTEGTYWLSVAGFTPAASRWNWTGSTIVDGANGQLIDATDYFEAGATNWTDILNLVPSGNPDFSFSINGSGYMTSINEEEMIELSIFPNPAIDMIHINAHGETVNQASIFNLNGQRITTIVNPNDNTVDLSELPFGTYIMEISTVKGSIGKVRFVK